MSEAIKTQKEFDGENYGIYQNGFLINIERSQEKDQDYGKSYKS